MGQWAGSRQRDGSVKKGSSTGMQSTGMQNSGETLRIAAGFVAYWGPLETFPFFSAAAIEQSPLERCSVVHYIMNFIKYCPLHYNVSPSLCFGIISKLSRSIIKDIIEKQNSNHNQT